MDEYWQNHIQLLGRHVLFVDTGAILGWYERGNDEYRKFFKSVVGWRLVTSTYVLTETVRRIAKSKTRDQFAGPSGERTGILCLHFLQEWLAEQNVRVLCVPDIVFEHAKDVFREYHAIGCDLNDVLSSVIVKGLEQTEIVSPDREHFGSLGLTCLP